MPMNSYAYSHPRSLRRAVLALAMLTAPLTLSTVAPARADDAPPPIVRVADVSVQGGIEDGVLTFKGIPYAADTSGKNRFRAPQPLTGWAGAFNATQYGPTCPGFGGLPPPGFADAPEGKDPNLTPPSEDCLRLNVWTPAAEGKRPVIVFLHGGGLVTGTGNISWYDGTRLAKNDDVVFVTLNYRLNTFGALYLGALDPSYAKDANPGLQDVVAALAWVRDNIASFGGDPKNVTVMGQSAGADIALLLMGMPSAEGLFARVIADSPAATHIATPEEAASQARAVLGQLGVGAGLNGLTDAPSAKLLAAFAGNGLVADGTVLPTGITYETAAMASPSVRLLIGWNATENTFFEGPNAIADDNALRAALKVRLKLEMFARAATSSYAKYYPSASPAELYFRITADLDFGTTVLAIANAKSHLGSAPVYVYRFDGRTEVGGLMSPHALELGYVLDNLALTSVLTGEVTPAKQETADTLSHAWTSFARNGEPLAPGLPEWPIYRTAADAAASANGTTRMPDPILMSLDQSPEAIPVPERTQGITGQ